MWSRAIIIVLCNVCMYGLYGQCERPASPLVSVGVYFRELTCLRHTLIVLFLWRIGWVRMQQACGQKKIYSSSPQMNWGRSQKYADSFRAISRYVVLCDTCMRQVLVPPNDVQKVVVKINCQFDFAEHMFERLYTARKCICVVVL